ncbi:MAG: SufD family Fe-S cluster assembly protein [Nitrosopumilaceae archaeon]|nr:SufD family Fe-S cluster assembly protein [Nitrososphaeria archaeon]NDB63144.1 SufD family Fe-S cluster assembly protein [Nitrosopumilaceae archaeon]NDB89217.1 SufD family Fe-S cluster assembly protein [Nitrososphaerota archaeon]NDF34341.1 SufD family Fe-S cluster assembly protein [Nitrosopumilaceae archaeon]NDF46973.1 SufD family Fe-S cluster assembly protein [Nitrosopumilaceae archaeon]
MQQALSTINTGHVDEISESKKEPDWLKQFRKKSFTIYESLPPEVSPLYNKYTDAKRMNPAEVSLVTDSQNTVYDGLKPRLAELEKEIHIIQTGTNIFRINLPEDLKAKGVVISSIYDAIQNHSELVKKVLESSDPKEDKYTALNNAAFNSGIFIKIPKNLILDRPIHIVSCIAPDGTSTISKNIIIAEQSSKASIVQELYAPKGSKQQAYLELLTVDAQPNSQLSMTTFQAMDQSAVNFSTRNCTILQDAKINWYLGLYGSMLSRYRTNYYLDGVGAYVEDAEIVFGDNEQSFDLSANLIHKKQATEGKVVQRSVLRNKSKSLFKGMIKILEGASQSRSFLSGRSILLDKDAKSDAIPGLEILTNDVKATHSASVAQVDEEQIFYLNCRCLDRAEAERIIVEGFLEPMSRTMSYQVRAWIAYLVESKWAGRDLILKSDENLRAIVEVEEVRYKEADQIETHYKYR